MHKSAPKAAHISLLEKKKPRSLSLNNFASKKNILRFFSAEKGAVGALPPRPRNDIVYVCMFSLSGKMLNKISRIEMTVALDPSSGEINHLFYFAGFRPAPRTRLVLRDERRSFKNPSDTLLF